MTSPTASLSRQSSETVTSCQTRFLRPRGESARIRKALYAAVAADAANFFSPNRPMSSAAGSVTPPPRNLVDLPTVSTMEATGARSFLPLAPPSCPPGDEAARWRMWQRLSPTLRLQRWWRRVRAWRNRGRREAARLTDADRLVASDAAMSIAMWYRRCLFDIRVRFRIAVGTLPPPKN